MHVSPAVLLAIGRLVRWRPRPQAWHHFIIGYCYWRGVRRAIADRQLWRRLTGGTVVLMYHAFARQGQAVGRYVVSARSLRLQLAWLRLTHRPVISLEELVDLYHEHRLPPARAVVITIDDGYKDAYEVAYPIFRRRALPATMYLVSQRLGGAAGME